MTEPEWVLELLMMLAALGLMFLLTCFALQGVPYVLTQWTGPRIAPPSFSIAWPIQAIMTADGELGLSAWLSLRSDIVETFQLPFAFRLVTMFSSPYKACTTLCYNPTLSRLIRDYRYWRSKEATEDIAQVIKPGPAHTKYPDEIPTESLAIGIYRQGQSEPTSNSFLRKSYTVCLIFGIMESAMTLYEHHYSGDWIILAVTFGGIILSSSQSSLYQWSRQEVPPMKLEENDRNRIAFINTEKQANTPILILGDQGDLDLPSLACSTETLPTSASKSLSVFFAISWMIWLAGVYNQFLRCPGTIIILFILGVINTQLVDFLARTPAELSIPLTYVGVIGAPNSIDAIIELEKHYPLAGTNFLDQFIWGHPFEKKNLYPERFSPLDAPEEITETWEKIQRLHNDPNRLAEIQILQQNRTFPNTVRIIYAKSKTT